MTLTKDFFENINSKKFEISFNPNDKSICELIEIKSLASSALKKGQVEPFSLIFETAGDLVYEQNTYRVKNQDLDEFDLFLVPVGADENGVRYEAIFT